MEKIVAPAPKSDRERKLANERRYVDQMIALLDLRVDGDVIHFDEGTAPRPDFRMRLTSGKAVAIEVTEARTETLAAGDGAIKRLIKETTAQVVRLGLTAQVNISINEGCASILNAKPNVLLQNARAIAALVPEAFALGCESWRRFGAKPPPRIRPGMDYDPRRLGTLGIDFVDSVLIRHCEQLLVTRSGGLHPNGWKTIQDAIDRKVPKLPAYRATGDDEYWLLVVGSAGTGGSIDSFSVDDQVFASPFDRTVFLELHDPFCGYLTTKTQTLSPTTLNQ